VHGRENTKSSNILIIGIINYTDNLCIFNDDYNLKKKLFLKKRKAKALKRQPLSTKQPHIQKRDQEKTKLLSWSNNKRM